MHDKINILELLSDRTNLKVIKCYFGNPSTTKKQISNIVYGSSNSKEQMAIGRKIRTLEQFGIIVRKANRIYELSQEKNREFKISSYFSNPNFFKGELNKMKKNHPKTTILQSQNFSKAKIYNSNITQTLNNQKIEDIKPLVKELSKIITSSLKEDKSKNILKMIRSKIPTFRGITEGMISTFLSQMIINADKIPIFLNK